MRTGTRVSAIQVLAAAAAVLFGLATLAAGGRVLLGADPGYVVFRPLLLYNVAMGVAYIAAGVAIWRRPRAGLMAARVIALLNAVVLAGVVALHRSGAAVATESVRAMTLRTVVWVVIALVVARAVSASHLPPASRRA